MEVLKIPHEQLKYEFQDILFNTKQAAAVDHAPEKVDYKALLYQTLSKEDTESLQRIAEMLRSTDHFHDCVQMYIRSRKETVDTIHVQLLKEMNVESIHVFACWEELNDKIQWWVQIARICIGNIFVEEKRLYKQIFGGLGTTEDAADQGYAYIIVDASTMLFEFPNTLMSSRRFPQKLEILLPLYQEFLFLMPVIGGLFPKDSFLTKNIHDHASGTIFRLAQHIPRLISASERHVLRELSIYPTPGGAIHPLTEYVISYVGLIFNYRKSLSDLIVKLEGSNDLAIQELDSLETDQFQTNPLKHHVIRIIGFLFYNLRYKCKFYDHESLRYFFMMNNVHHIAQKIESSPGLQEICGHNYLMKVRGEVKEAMTGYLKKTWNVVFYLLRDERSKPQGKWSSLFGKSSRAVKEKLNTFNLMINNILQRQEEWEVPDKQLRKMLHKSILDKLIPAYTHFLEQYRGEIHKLHHPKLYIQYSVKELESKILDMFLYPDQIQTAAKASMINLKQVSTQNKNKGSNSNSIRQTSSTFGALALEI